MSGSSSDGDGGGPAAPAQQPQAAGAVAGGGADGAISEDETVKTPKGEKTGEGEGGEAEGDAGEKQGEKKRGWCCTCCFSLTTIAVVVFLAYVGFTAKTFAAIAVPGGFGGFNYERDARGNIVNTFKPLATEGMRLDFEAYLSVLPQINPNGIPLVWTESDVAWDFSHPDGHQFNTTVSPDTVGAEMWHNLRQGNAFVHIFGRQRDSSDGNGGRNSKAAAKRSKHSKVLVSSVTQLVHETVIARVIRKPRFRLLRPWLGDCGCGAGVSTVEAADAAVLLAKELELASGPPVPTPHWKPNATFRMAVDFTEYPRDQIPALAARRLRLAGRNGPYLPVLYHDEMWATSEKLLPLNDTVTSLPLTISLAPASFGRWQLGEQMGDALVLMEQAMGATDKEKDDVKRLITDTNPLLLVSILLVSLLHLLFDTLAFKNDIQFWKNLEKMDGLSGRAQTGSLVLQVVVLAYLHHEESSILVLAPAAFGVLVQAWKCFKVVRLAGFSKDTSTSEADEVAYEYLSKMLLPFVIGFAIFSCHCEAHEGWYAMLLTTAVQTVYIMGFIVMTPQLFINYKMKSVAALPWRMLVYRTLNTFIDDLFAFVIKMPTMHRLSCFRDDIVFFVYLYQRWLYPVDLSRPVLGMDMEETGSEDAVASNNGNQPQQRRRPVDGGAQ